MENEISIAISVPNHITVGIPSPDGFGDIIKEIVVGEKIWPPSSGNDLTTLEDERKRLAHEIFAGAEFVDLVGHSTPIKCYLKLGDWVLDPAGVEQLASYLPRSVKIVRLIGCNTASTEEGRAAVVAFTRSGMEAYGTLSKVYATHFDKDGVKMVPGAPSMRGFSPAEPDPDPLPTSSGTSDRSRLRGLLIWLGRGPWKAISGLYRVFIRFLPEQWTLRSRIWGDLHSKGELMPGLLTEPLLIFEIASRSGNWMLEILFDFEYARFYPSVRAAEQRDRVYGIRGFGKVAKTPLEAYLERSPHGVTLKKSHEEAGDRCRPKGAPRGAGQKPGRSFLLVSVIVIVVALAVLLALFTLSTSNAPIRVESPPGGPDALVSDGGTPTEPPSDAPADGGGTPPQIPSDAPVDGGDTPPRIPPGGDPPGCATLAPIKTYEGFVASGGYTSPQSYDSAMCHQGLSIQINHYSASYLGAKDHDYGGTFVDWADAALTTKSECEAAFVRADLYRQISGKWTRVSSKQNHGNWMDFFGNWTCAPPNMGWRNADDDPDLLIAGSNYRIVSTARTSPSGATRKFRVSSIKDGWIR